MKTSEKHTHIVNLSKGYLLYLPLFYLLFLYLLCSGMDYFLTELTPQFILTLVFCLSAILIQKKTLRFNRLDAILLLFLKTAYMTIISGYLLLKGSSDPRKKTKASYSEKQVFDLIFGDQIQYFEATFGEQFNLTK